MFCLLGARCQIEPGWDEQVLASQFLFVIIGVVCAFIFLFLFVSTNQFIFVIILVNCVYSVKGGGVPIQMKDSDPRLPENNLDITNIHVLS